MTCRQRLWLLAGVCVILGVIPLWANTPSDPAASKAHLQVERLSAARTAVRLAGPEVTQGEQWVDYRRLVGYAIEGEEPLPAEGRPTVPQVSRFYQIPNRGAVRLELGTLEYDVVEDIDALPLMTEEPAFGQITRDAAVYGKDAWYPPEVAVLSEPAIFRDLRVAQLVLYPVQVNPVTRQARIYRNLEAEIVTTAEAGENELLNPRPLSGAYVPLYRSLVANLDETLLAGATTAPGSYLIISSTNPVLLPYVDSLAEWKTRKGFRVVADSRNDWTSATILAAIRSAYDTWDPPLEYVCLMGDPIASGFGVPVCAGGQYDHGFALVAGNDELEDVSVGRLSGADGSQMAVINAKLMHYERDPFMADTTWFTRAFFYASVGHTVASNWTLMQWAAQQFRSWTGVTNINLRWHNGSVNEEVVRNEADSLAFFFWRGSWLSEMSSTLAGTLNTGWQLPVVACLTCGTGNYDNSLSIAESYVVAGSVNNPQGGVAAIGSATSANHSPQMVTFTGGLIFAIANQGFEHLGTCLTQGKAWLFRTYGLTDSRSRDHARWINLMGDPSLSMWTDVPEQLTVLHPASLDVGTQSVTVTVRRAADSEPVENALVVLWKRGVDSTWVRGVTDADGQITLPVTIRQSGGLLVTVTKQNHKPYLWTIPCGFAATAPMYCRYTLDDDNSGGTAGNGNGRLEGGETVELAVYVRNYGTETASAVSATMTSGNPRVTVVQNMGLFGNLAAGDSALGDVPFRISAAPQLQSGEAVELALTIQSPARTATGTIFLTASGAALDYYGQAFSGALTPGMTRTLAVTLINRGSQTLAGVTASLISLSPFVFVPDSAGAYLPIPAGGFRANEPDLFTVHAHPSTYRGHMAPMLLIARSVEGWSDTVQFTLTVGLRDSTDPVGPDGYGYYAYDNGDTAYGLHPTFNYLDISSGLGMNLNLNDVGEKNDITQLTSTARALPFAFKFYGQVYDTITICSNGWCAFGDQSWNDNFRNYPIPAMQAPQAMIAPFWQDLCTAGTGLGVWAYRDTDNHRYVIQWKAAAITIAGACGAFSYDFEVLLYDTTYYPTADGNGKVVVQYRRGSTAGTVDISQETPSAGIGIQDRRGLVGIGYYNYIPGYAPGAAAIDSGRAILFTTEALVVSGAVDVTVLDSTTMTAVPGATVTIVDCNQTAVTDGEGVSYFLDVPAGYHTVRVTRRGYNPAEQAGMYVIPDQPTSFEIHLVHPAIAIDPEMLLIRASEPVDSTFTLANPGTGPLDYRVEALLPGDARLTPWDSVGAVGVSSLTGDTQIRGCEFAANRWWVTGNDGVAGQNVLYQFSRAGALLGQIPQYSTGSGWSDLAWDGVRLYGSDGAQIFGIDPEGELPVDTIYGPLNPCRALAYDAATEHFWVADLTSEIFEIDRAGTVIHQLSNQGSAALAITGLAWNAADSLGYSLYLFGQGSSGERRVMRMDPASGQRLTVANLPGATGETAGGLAITSEWTPLALVAGVIVQSTLGDRLEIREVQMQHSWIRFTPAAGELAAGGQQQIMVHIEPSYLPADMYTFDVRVFSAVLDTSRALPVSLAVVSDAEEPIASRPTSYRLHPNYPNPFNPVTTIAYELTGEALTRLRVYNLLGECVAELVNTRQGAGAYRVAFDAASLPSGMYFYRLESGSFVKTRKMILLK